ncbi:hypothetical protein GCM10011371_16880 [Novosphingobium marinum]|nr:hypothetical protein GCM10011371_16880 [Novosphingobium marinum]
MKPPEQDNPNDPSTLKCVQLDRDLNRAKGIKASGPCEPHTKAGHMGASTRYAKFKLTLANGEPSTQGSEAEVPLLEKFGQK